MEKIKIYLDGKEVLANPGETILEVAKRNGIDIPTLCHDPRLEPFTSCFVCVVEVEGAKGFVPSCATKVTDGMKITTNSENVLKTRKMALELLASNHYADCLGTCKMTCPAGVDVQGYIALIAMGRYSEAVSLIKETNPFPSVCGRVCTRPCEGKCRRNNVDEPVAIDYLKRYATDLDMNSEHPFTPTPKPPTGRKVAIIGGGPGGLSAAYYLALEGHSVTVFEAKEKAGGMLRYGIPPYRLPDEILDYEIDSILKLGVELKTNTAFGRDFTLEDLKRDGYEAIFIGIGAQKSMKMNIKGEEAKEVMAGIEFLEQVNGGKIKSISGRVAVVGGGNTAIDAARTSVRLGADEVIMIYRRTKKEMPAHHSEIEEAEREGVKIQILTNPVEYLLDENGKLRGVRCIKMKLGEPDSSGRRRPIPIEGSEFDMEVDWVFEAIGQKPDLDLFATSELGKKLEFTPWKTIKADPDTMATNLEGIFAGGDALTGAATAIEAIAAGQKAAKSIHSYLTKGKIERLKKPFISMRENLNPDLSKEEFERFPKIPRNDMPMLPVEKRINSFDEVELGYTEDLAMAEVKRCLECGCQAFFNCELQKHCTEYEVEQGKFRGEYHAVLPDESHPFLRLDMNKCILCGRCVRICEEVVGIAALGFVKRGFDAYIKPALEKPLLETQCISCGNCADTCPTGAITEKVDAPKPGPWNLPTIYSTCTFCGVGCGVGLQVIGDRIVKIISNKETIPNDGGNLCVKGRFGFRVLNSPDRLIKPMVKDGGDFKETDFNSAYDLIGKRIKEIVEKYGSESVAVLGSSRFTLEENYLIQKFARKYLGTLNVFTLSAINKYDVNEYFVKFPTTTYEGLLDSDVIFVSNVETIKSYPVFDFKLKKAKNKLNRKIVLLNPQKSNLDKFTIFSKHLPPEAYLPLYQLLIKEVVDRKLYTVDIDSFENGKEFLNWVNSLNRDELIKSAHVSEDDISKLIDILKSGKVTFVYDRENSALKFAATVFNLAKLLGADVLPLIGKCGAQGVFESGVLPDFLPGQIPLLSEDGKSMVKELWGIDVGGTPLSYVEFSNRLESGKIKALFIFGEDPVGCQKSGESFADVLKNVEFLVVSDLFKTETAQLADVLLPAASFAETYGIFVNSERRAQLVRRAMEPKSGKDNIEIISDLCALFENGSRETLDGVREELFRFYPELKDLVESEDVKGVVLKSRANDFLKKNRFAEAKDYFKPPYLFMMANDINGKRLSKMLKELKIVKPPKK